MVKLVAAGLDLRIPAGEYEAFTPGDLPRDDMVELVAEAAAHGGCVAELPPAFEGDEPSYVFVLAVDTPVLLFEVDGTATVFPGLAGDRTAYVAFGSSGCLGPAIAPTSFVLGYADERGHRVWEGERWKIRPHPISAEGRAWPWRGSGSFGPYSLTVYVDVSSAELEEFVAACAPLPYERTAANRYELSDVGRIEIVPGQLSILRALGRGEVADHVEAFDRGLVLALARGARGPVHWVAVEHDWETPFAIGDDGASLAEYLVGDRDAVDAAQTKRLGEVE